MSTLQDLPWKIKYDSDAGSLVKDFYVPALECAVRYDRTTGYFSAAALTLASLGVEGLVGNGGRMRLLVGCTLGEAEVKAIEKGQALRDTVAARILGNPLRPADHYQTDALELLAWMIAKGYLEVKVAIPCTAERKPYVSDSSIFHEKAGILEDKVGNRVAFSGSVNETTSGWTTNWESFHVFLDWDSGKAHVDAEEESFARLWADKAQRALVIDVLQAVHEDLLRFLPQQDTTPRRLRETRASYFVNQPTAPEELAPPPTQPAPMPNDELRKLVWGIIRYAPQLPGGGERIGEATANVTPWDHQVRAFHRMYDHWPPKLLIADEVGLGKTIEAGLLLRQAVLAEKAKRVLILAPKAVLSQWQLELREKFNLNWPIYDGQQLSWYPSPAYRHSHSRRVDRHEWHDEPYVLASSQLMRRQERARELLQEAEPYDLIVLDEAHHARRKGAGSAESKGPNQLLRLMRSLKERTGGLILLTATPMQVDPIEVWDLMDLLGLPQAWDPQAFLDFFALAAKPNPSNDEFEVLASLFRDVEAFYGPTSRETFEAYVPGSRLAATRVANALRDKASTPRRQLETEQRHAAIRLMRANTPVARLVSRHTRELLRKYYEAGKITTPIARRSVDDAFVDMTPDERLAYEAVEDYITTTYNNAAAGERNAVGFVMTIYRRRMASSFAALAATLEGRLEKMRIPNSRATLEEDIPDDQTRDEVMDEEEAAKLEKEALQVEERQDIVRLLAMVRDLPLDTKAGVLANQLRNLKSLGYKQVMVFTQYTDTMDFLREYLVHDQKLRVLCFSGLRGGERLSGDGSWRTISRDEVKRIFREGDAEVLLCTDAAAEGLNFQFCGAVINYEMPWNPMRVEQRIGRIDRLGQRFEVLRIANLHYNDTVETEIYMALRQRIDLFSKFVGKLQPILARLPGVITAAVLSRRGDQAQQRETILRDIEEDIQCAEQAAFDLDDAAQASLDEPARPDALYSLHELDCVLQGNDLLPPGVSAKPLGNGEYEFSAPGIESVRVTTNASYFDDHPESLELWSPGNPAFLALENTAPVDKVIAEGGRMAFFDLSTRSGDGAGSSGA
ncbi:MAG: DEAD/DEAH box helicase family protein [Chloroflexi bacterium]|nr:DEAD/DEAH box helicase family protein [Chloroflexota bacterium]